MVNKTALRKEPSLFLFFSSFYFKKRPSSPLERRLNWFLKHHWLGRFVETTDESITPLASTSHFPPPVLSSNPSGGLHVLGIFPPPNCSYHSKH